MYSKNILLVEDNKINQKLAKEVLARAGYEVTVANHGREALECLDKGNFSVVLMDLKMPIMDGYETISLIRKNSALEKQQVVCVSAVVHLPEVEKILASGFDYHIGKPLDFEELYGLLERITSDSSPANSTKGSTAEDSPVSDNSELAMDLETALKSHAGDLPLLTKLLSEFIKHYSTVDSDISKLIDNGEWISAERMAHNIKGVAGNFGAEPLRSCAALLEKAFNTNPSNTNDYTDLMARFSESHRKFMIEAEKFIAENTKK